jgi:hypothetical protein
MEISGKRKRKAVLVVIVAGIALAALASIGWVAEKKGPLLIHTVRLPFNAATW